MPRVENADARSPERTASAQSGLSIVEQLQSTVKGVGARALGSTFSRRGLRAVLQTPKQAADGPEGSIFRLAKRATYPPEAGFRYVYHDCAPVDLCFAGAALHLYYLGDYEPETLKPITALAKQARTFLDIGAQVGVYSIIIASANPAIEVVAFEANPAATATLLENVRRNTGRTDIGRIRVYSGAVDDTSGMATFHLAGGNSSLNAEFRGNTRELLCPTVSIDAFIDRTPITTPIDLVKIDTESTEPAVLRGMSNTIDRWRPIITLEVLRGRTEHELNEFLNDKAYTAVWLRNTGPVAVENIVGDGTYAELNYLLVPRERHDEVLTTITASR